MQSALKLRSLRYAIGYVRMFYEVALCALTNRWLRWERGACVALRCLRYVAYTHTHFVHGGKAGGLRHTKAWHDHGVYEAWHCKAITCLINFCKWVAMLARRNFGLGVGWSAGGRAALGCCKGSAKGVSKRPHICARL